MGYNCEMNLCLSFPKPIDNKTITKIENFIKEIKCDAFGVDSTNIYFERDIYRSKNMSDHILSLSQIINYLNKNKIAYETENYINFEEDEKLGIVYFDTNKIVVQHNIGSVEKKKYYQVFEINNNQDYHECGSKDYEFDNDLSFDLKSKSLESLEMIEKSLSQQMSKDHIFIVIYKLKKIIVLCDTNKLEFMNEFLKLIK